MFNEYENTLRKIILLVLGENPESYKISQDRILKWKEKKDIKLTNQKPTINESRIIYFSDFYDLVTIITKNWDKFQPVLLNKKRFEIFFAEIESCRNEIAHGREITSYQDHLLKGITLDLKSLLTVYYNKNQMITDYFIRILKVSDNLGNIWEDSVSSKKVTLREGDYYELIIDAHDPKSREIEYELRTVAGFSLKQKSNRFNFTIPKLLISQSTSLICIASTPSSDYTNQDILSFRLIVLPK